MLEHLPEIERLLRDIEAIQGNHPGSRTRKYAQFRRLYRLIAPNGRVEPWVFDGALLKRIGAAVGGNSLTVSEYAILLLEPCLQDEAFREDGSRVAQVHELLGEAYHKKSLVSQDASTDLSKAREHYDAALEQYELTGDITHCAMIHRRLGNLFRIQGARDAALEELERALTDCSRDECPHEWVQLHSDIAMTLLEGDDAESPELALGHLETALNAIDRNSMPEAWADLQMQVGMAYRYRIRGEKLTNLQTATKHYLDALPIFIELKSKYQCARAQSALGDVWLRRSQFGEGAFIAESVGYFKSAQGVYAEDSHPYEWANLERDIGIALTDANELTGDNAKLAFAHFQNAIRVYEALGKNERAQRTRELLKLKQELLELDEQEEETWKEGENVDEEKGTGPYIR